jgi:Ca2+/Na+ antiporter
VGLAEVLQDPLPPQLFAFLGFFTSALWINAAATEVVNILRSLGIVFRLSNTVLGLTLLAWGNSIGGDSGRGGAGVVTVPAVLLE